MALYLLFESTFEPTLSVDDDLLDTEHCRIEQSSTMVLVETRLPSTVVEVLVRITGELIGCKRALY